MVSPLQPGRRLPRRRPRRNERKEPWHGRRATSRAVGVGGVLL